MKEKFDIGKVSGRKVDPFQAADEMRQLQEDGKYVFSRKDYLTGQQITAYFSRLALKDRKTDLEDFRSAEEETNKRCLKQEILDMVVEAQKCLCNLIFNSTQALRICSHTVNLLTNIPRDCYQELLIPLNEMDIEGMENKEVEYDGRNMEAIILLLNFLFSRLDRPYKSLKESLTPILHCLCEMCRANRSIRKFCRVRVLPPLKDEVKKLPEEGESFRNRLCKLLTSPITEVKDLVADFLFVMCKESVQRMVKYTGYGNCAGLLANRGLLLGGKTDGNYSSNSDDSETEEYSHLKESVNPVTGRYETEKSNPFEGMSDEQKEYEAMKLVNAMDKLQRGGIIQPSVVGPDGRPQPVEHILELTENMNIEDQTKETSED
ncbi:Synembryn-A,Synembryn,Synembryn-B [Mytilus coruscus]|uniref:Synembryn-A,Synembryn,Synembryn-B n=1 Tax=Mytilus coruscus TaxID=42192 RepID=A0A6J8BRJ5_MYTCO|nr:Synembryn-A,Synembryn,Synembryn-B [Mytilus coruscus]